MVSNKNYAWESRSSIKYYRGLMVTTRGSHYCYKSVYIKPFVFILDIQLKAYLSCNDYSLSADWFDYVYKEWKWLPPRWSLVQAQTPSQGIKYWAKAAGSLSQAWSQHSFNAQHSSSYHVQLHRMKHITHLFFSDVYGVGLSMLISKEGTRRVIYHLVPSKADLAMLRQKMPNGI